MDDTLAPWLRLREPADAAARSLPLTRAIAGSVCGHDVIEVLDLATGTGANLRYLAPHLPGRQRWRLVDRDPALLALVPSRTASWAAARGATIVGKTDTSFVICGKEFECEVGMQQLDLGSLEEHAGIFAGRHLVTASALLDLTSKRWLQALAGHCRATGAAALFALTYDGSSTCVPAEPEDDWIRDLLNRHQHRDAGLGGPAEGPDATAAAIRAFTAEGYRVECAPSPWTLDASTGELQRQLIDGWGAAATEMAPDESAAIASWRARRGDHVDAHRSRIVVGHVDVAAWPEECQRPMRSQAP